MVEYKLVALIHWAKSDYLHQRGTSYRIEVWNRPIMGIAVGSPLPDLETTARAKKRGKAVVAGRGICRFLIWSEHLRVTTSGGA
ncbi:hypothetical protein MJO28_007297 [Puccinia striiformis f. sp. tritici]|uniref:Uncharacterized protein n=1 Tax=Puccinia striiformis f. sp. tritici TaxID=168172 RepID=A0ACC0EFA1_9BASI|nr:hypothetical protein MJO28_007297 [Puccinia striiformis f. sp. tritici]KAI7955842.1 hypothetical protein MJO29_007241 [Puccinia striiformis f. sp. tritici]